MKKKLMMVALLLGGISLGACVDDNETQSVTDVRNAKAEQLQARADMNNAAAQAAKISADAALALAEAQAQAREAVAKRMEAETATLRKQIELKELEAQLLEAKTEEARLALEAKKVKLDLELSNLEVTKASAEKEIESIKNQLALLEQNSAALLADAKADLLRAQQAVLAWEQQQADAAAGAEADALRQQQAALTAASNAYVAAVDWLSSVQQQLISAKTTLTRLENGLVDLNLLKEQTIADNTNQIEVLNALIDTYKQFDKFLTPDEVAAYEVQLRDLNKKVTLQNQTAALAWKAYYAINPDLTARKEAHDAVMNHPYLKLVDSRQVVWMDGEMEIVEDLSYMRNLAQAYLGNSDYYFVNMVPDGRIYTYAKEYDIEFDMPYAPYQIITHLGDSIDFVKVWQHYDFDVRIMQVRLDELKAAIEAYRKGEQERVDGLQADYNGEATGRYTWGYNGDAGYWDYWYTEFADDATDKLNAVAYTAKLKAAYEADKTKAEAKRAYEAALDVELWLKRVVDNSISAMYQSKRDLQMVEAYAALMLHQDTQMAELKTLIDKRNEADVAAYAAKVAAYQTAAKAEMEVTLLNAEISAIQTAINNHDNVQYYINNYQNQIDQLQAEIDAYEALGTGTADIDNQEKLIELQKMRIDRLNVLEKAAQADVNDTKADFDALLAK